MDVSSLGKYEIRGTLGRGAMGTVYEGWDPVISRKVAIKTVRLPDAADVEAQEELARFRREAQAAGRLTHPNIVGVFDYGETSELAYIVMEFIDGHSLKAPLDKHERFVPAEIVRIMEQLLHGLQFSHERGVVHRDIKPANVMLTLAGQVKIADFGIARIESSSMTQAGTVLGTPAYMSPEQFMGQTVDARTDIYSSGILLYQLLTGERPFEGSMSAIMHKALNVAPPAPSALSVTVPAGFDAVVGKAIAKRPEERFESAAVFAKALRDAFEQPVVVAPVEDSDATVIRPSAKPAVAPVVPPPTVPPSKPLQPATRGMLPVAIGGGVAGVAVLGAIAWFVVVPLLRQPVTDIDPNGTTTPSNTTTQEPRNNTNTTPDPRTASNTNTTPPDPRNNTNTTPDPRTANITNTTPPDPRNNTNTTPDPRTASNTNTTPPDPRNNTNTTPDPRTANITNTTPPDPRNNTNTTPDPRTANITNTTPPDPRNNTNTTPDPRTANNTNTTTPDPRNNTNTTPDPRNTTAAIVPPPRPAVTLAALRAAVQRVPCTLPFPRVTDQAQIGIDGLSGRGNAETALRTAVAELSPAANLTWRVRSFDSTVSPAFCDAVDTLRRAGSLDDRAGPELSIALKGNVSPLRKNDLLVLEFKTPDFAAYLQVDYLQGDGSMFHMVQDDGTAIQEFDGTKWVVITPSRSFKPQSRVAVGQKGRNEIGPNEVSWPVDQPFGTDMVIAIASSAPLFPRIRPGDETFANYRRDLNAAIDAARARGVRLSVQALLVTTVER